jgi:predicted phage terminase large subunit-like protein
MGTREVSLWPERFPLEDLKRRERLNPREFASLYQQSPYVLGGNLIKTQWWQRYPIDVNPNTFPIIIIAVDTAFKKTETSDYSVAVVAGIDNIGDIYILDVQRGKWEYPDLKRRLVALNNRWRGHGLRAFYVEDKASGQSIIQDLKRESGLAIVPYKVVFDKVARVNSILPLIEGGRVHLPDEAPWLDAFVEECVTFPGSTHDDQVDALAMALDVLARTGITHQWESLDQVTGSPLTTGHLQGQVPLGACQHQPLLQRIRSNLMARKPSLSVKTRREASRLQGRWPHRQGPRQVQPRNRQRPQGSPARRRPPQEVLLRPLQGLDRRTRQGRPQALEVLMAPVFFILTLFVLIDGNPQVEAYTTPHPGGVPHARTHRRQPAQGQPESRLLPLRLRLDRPAGQARLTGTTDHPNQHHKTSMSQQRPYTPDDYLIVDLSDHMDALSQYGDISSLLTDEQEKRIVQYAKSLLDMSHSRISKRYDYWREADRAHDVYVPPDTTQFREKAVIPDTRAIADTVLTYLMSALAGRNPMFQLEGLNRKSRKPALILERVLHQHLRRTGGEAQIAQQLLDSVRYGFAPTKVIWDAKSNQNKIVNFDPRRTFPDPRVNWGDWENMQFIGFVSYLSFNALLNSGLYPRLREDPSLRKMADHPRVSWEAHRFAQEEGKGLSIDPTETMKGDTHAFKLGNARVVDEIWLRLSGYEIGVPQVEQIYLLVTIMDEETVIRFQANPYGQIFPVAIGGLYHDAHKTHGQSPVRHPDADARHRHLPAPLQGGQRQRRPQQPDLRRPDPGQRPRPDQPQSLGRRAHPARHQARRRRLHRPGPRRHARPHLRHPGHVRTEAARLRRL